MLMLLFVDKIQEKFPNTIFDVFENPRSYIASLALLSFAISMILAYISIVKINKICVLCFCTYVVDFLIMIISLSVLGHIKATIVDFIKGAKKYFILFLIVLFAFVGTVYYLNDSYILSPKLKAQKSMFEFVDAERNKYAIKGNVLGKEDAKVKVSIYSDLSCPFCRIVNMMLHKLAREGDILVQDVHFPLDSHCNRIMKRSLGGHENSCLESKYALAAKKQGKYWGVANILFDSQPGDEGQIIQLIEKSGLDIDMNKLKSDAHSPEISKELQNDIKNALAKNINATPSIEINGVIFPGALSYDELKENIKLAKNKQGIYSKQ